jgi:hypothetical protein
MIEESGLETATGTIMDNKEKLMNDLLAMKR